MPETEETLPGVLEVIKRVGSGSTSHRGSGKETEGVIFRRKRIQDQSGGTELLKSKVSVLSDLMTGDRKKGGRGISLNPKGCSVSGTASFGEKKPGSAQESNQKGQKRERSENRDLDAVRPATRKRRKKSEQRRKER